ncbi:dTMP kinase [Psychromonas sp. SP041]|uniref:dTMP kinase n=1 Tax=Psychromonas sp. SP041 TaxID=1365007 RepID=UPI00042011B2|nr:dTMP kinase [Psychromonas sp. SP041]
MMNKFIEIEGNDGTGKGLAISQVIKFLQEKNEIVISTREPGGTPLAEKIREITKSNEISQNEIFAENTELLLMYSARSQLLENKIKPSLSMGHFVTTDRFSTSSFAYQGFARGLDLGNIEMLEKMIVGKYAPSLTIILDCPPEVSISRAINRSALDRFENQKLDFFRTSRAGYLEIAKSDPVRYKVINANRPISEVHMDVLEVLSIWYKNLIN